MKWLFALFSAGLLAMGWLYYVQWDEGRKSSDFYEINALVQKGAGKGAIPTKELALMMGLSANKPQNLFQFDCRLAEEKLLACPRIARASVSAIKPSIVVVDYEVKAPIAAVADYEKCGLASDGTLIPLWEESSLPTVILGGEPPRMDLIGRLIKVFPEADTEMDFSRLNGTFAEREIIVTLKLKPPLYLRFNPDNLREGLKNYRRLVKRLEPEGIVPQTVDLRSSKLAFITEVEDRHD